MTALLLSSGMALADPFDDAQETPLTRGACDFGTHDRTFLTGHGGFSFENDMRPARANVTRASSAWSGSEVHFEPGADDRTELVETAPRRIDDLNRFHHRQLFVEEIRDAK